MNVKRRTSPLSFPHLNETIKILTLLTGQTNSFIIEQQNKYTCPAGAVLTTNGNSFEKKKKGRASYYVKKHETTNCSSCPFKPLCAKAQNRIIERSEW